jgi:hypothetical protein
MTLKVANFVMAHKAPRQLVRLVQALRSPLNLTIVHLDKKSTGPDWDHAIDEMKQMGTLFAARTVCSWGDFSFIQVTLNCIDKLRETGTSWDFVNQISGQDYPIRPMHELADHLSENRGRCLMELHPLPFPTWKFGGYNRLPTWRNPLSSVRAPLVPPRFARRFYRPVPLGHQPYGGSAWWCLPFEAVDYIDKFLRANPRYAKYWAESVIPDELVFHSILGNSPFQIPNGSHQLHYIKWSGGPNPDLLRQADLDNMQASRKFFARKFDDEQNPGMLDCIDAKLLGR